MSDTLSHPQKAFAFYRDVLKSPHVILAPMVDGSDTSFRSFVHKHGVDLCYTPMVLSKLFNESKTYRQEVIKTLDPRERPLVIQIVGHDPDEMGRAAKLLSKYCDVIDINLGCPQKIAQKGQYGAYLSQDLSQTEKVVKAVMKAVEVPVYCKIRVSEDHEKTMKLVDMLVACGIWGLCVHGRTIDEKQSGVYHARWEIISDIKKRVAIPVIANGGIATMSDIQKCKEITNADGFMIGMGLLLNPGLCEGRLDDNFLLASEYLSLAEELSLTCLVKFWEVKGHIIKMLIYRIRPEKDIVKEIGLVTTYEDIKTWMGKAEHLFRKRSDDISHSQDMLVQDKKLMNEQVLQPDEEKVEKEC
ncbi:tRNA-dihydrouridine synthase, putative [Entamoeba invadens IP1]|uniref:tRNA-dihydrouridine(16/17) synthase [NAD(P)(+)] n=1 Tax=Entamoeba invadens IP1 TaxID=370355 RepID=A0A0A1TUU0_ENTIV|nr:tRNA-dihydrouridine synthase, putative [Entamoeba invadens IP1]ELP83849.1 tRNA-dihydrouridine synthase, putative [Entamoeba invadens IP1]|eukprot:XP_004183195.1 tRNA-dihydrouridine synthase, putative [Entamoeba invadens IP1]